ncbi:hypothetical protein DVH24_021346 [Malus domestica]|uniref:40S ribosomal protein S27 n=1 Tax=Malus domestica TaxID=3750 RepID=A0A498K0V9_MALDO|nr:hypothetical protein DVH24_021346 [Malus domestica]
MVLQNDTNLLHLPAELEKRKHKLKRLVQTPNSFFMNVKCQGCFSITTVFSHSQTVVVCGNCQTVLCQPTGGRARLTEEKIETDAGTLIAFTCIWQIAKELCGDNLRSCLPMATVRLPIFLLNLNGRPLTPSPMPPHNWNCSSFSSTFIATS